MQVVGYDSLDGGLYLALSGGATLGDGTPTDPTEVEYLPLDAGDELAYRLGGRHCAGTVADEGHYACENDDAPHCEYHRSTWVCARCRGTCLKDEMDCFDDHAVYLAAFAPDVFKVGVTKEWRLDTRLREQGADRAAHLRTVENGRIAREIESELARELTDRVRVPTKRAGLHRRVDAEQWESLLAEFDPLDTFSFDYGFSLDSRPMGETIAAGRVIGTKGRLLVLENARTTYAVDMRDLVGYELREGESDRELQSSLGAFG
ncbi:DUF2797 domain-containing protein [Haloprofundus sp. MHR1]|uniref:DUF2797 domain-containing protein n=1 Tax=Haloprofundus sp. MHR1 TaxID=2572921 RepID=UPI0010BE9F5C|nr:DUF2797 domain-containing protein [Haloprofundus sp. MHR1]QCJ48149.1 DUF2797 domain-containing protein [Haloprofundus sp. MHR1]